jgi:hypothetical protein
MTTPVIRAALERLVELDGTSITMRSKQSSLAWSDAIAAARAALAAKPVGEGPGDEAPEKEAPIWYNSDMASSWQAGRQDGWGEAIARWTHPATPPAPEVGEA